MRRRRTLSSIGWTSLRVLGVSSVVWVGSACNSIDTTRQAPPAATLGDDLYGVMCDRVGASSLAEDLTGDSYHAICHHDDQGKYADKVDTSVLPAVSGPAGGARARGLAKVHAMARRRVDLIHAFNAIFPKIDIDNVATPDPNDKIPLHEALFSLGQTLSPLYETNPYDPDPNAEPLLPHSTRSLGRLFGAIADSDAARGAMTSIWGRQGYRPLKVALGAIRSALAYPALRDLTKAQLKVLGPQGFAVPELQQLLTVSKQELLTSKPVLASLPAFLVDAPTGQPNRPRSTVEVVARLLLDEDPAYASDPSEPSRFISLRDKRGFAVPFGGTPGLPGSVAAPFTDLDGDGFADVDPFGRFTDMAKAPLAIDPPFVIAGVAPLGALDDFGRPKQALYAYLDTSRSLTGSMARNLVPLVDATKNGADGDPNAWQSDHESLMYALSGAYSLYGDREDALYDYASDSIKKPGDACDGCLPYSRFKSEDSPIPDLVHAVGQILADKDSDVLLLNLMDLVENHEDVVARLMGAALTLKDIADKHDALAAGGTEKIAAMPYATPIWDEIAEVVARITAKPGLTKHLLEGLADDTIVTPIAGSTGLGDTLSRFMTYRDEMAYDQFNINGPAVNLTDGAPSTAEMHNAVDRKSPQSGKNRSAFQRAAQIIHDAKNVKACNKQDARVYAKLAGAGIYWPIIGSNYNECELFQFDNLAGFYLDSLLDANHPKRAQLNIKSGTLNAILNFLGALGTTEDQLLSSSSGIDGLGGHPTPQALNRLVWFGADSAMFPSMPDHDTVNEGSDTNKFVSNSIEPVGTPLCPQDGNGVNVCAAAGDTLRVRDYATIFTWERLGFYDYLRPVLTKFANVGCADDLSNCNQTDYTGEQIFVDLVDSLHRHWSGKEHGPECSPSGDATSNPAYCSEAGVNTYEPILADDFRTDIIPALHAFAKVAVELSKITVQRGPTAGQTLTGAELLESMTRILFDPAYAASVGMVDRTGKASAAWVNGKPQPQLTVYTLFADALHKIDTRFDAVQDKDFRKGQWKRARSQLVDQFLAVDGDGPTAKFKNAAMPRTLLTILRVAREQLNAHCPKRETGEACTWAKKDLGDKMAATLSGPLFAGLMDVQEQIRTDDPARRELEKFLGHILLASSSGDALQGSLASISDLLQVLANDGQLAPIFNAIANTANPAGDSQGAGVADTTIKVLSALVSDTYDRYHVVDQILPALVTPMDGAGATPVEIIMDTIAEVNRLDASSADPLDATDYKDIMQSVDGFLRSNTRGLEQFYYIVQHRIRE